MHKHTLYKLFSKKAQLNEQQNQEIESYVDQIQNQNTNVTQPNKKKSKAENVYDSWYSDDFKYDRERANETPESVTETAKENNKDINVDMPDGNVSIPETPNLSESQTNEINAYADQITNPPPASNADITNKSTDESLTKDKKSNDLTVWGTRDGFKYKTDDGWSEESFKNMDEANKAYTDYKNPPKKDENKKNDLTVWGTRDGFKYKTNDGWSEDSFNNMEEANKAYNTYMNKTGSFSFWNTIKTAESWAEINQEKLARENRVRSVAKSLYIPKFAQSGEPDAEVNTETGTPEFKIDPRYEGMSPKEVMVAKRKEELQKPPKWKDDPTNKSKTKEEFDKEMLEMMNERYRKKIELENTPGTPEYERKKKRLEKQRNRNKGAQQPNIPPSGFQA